MSESSDLRDQAEKCRRLAESGIDAMTIARLTALAVQYEERAAIIESQSKQPEAGKPA